MSTPSAVIGHDIGHSAVKTTAISKTGSIVKLLIPSVVCSAFSISDEAEAKRAEAETVVIDGRAFFIGDTARTQGGSSVSSGLTEDWIDSPEHAALLVGSLNKLANHGVDTSNPDLVLGLPTHLFTRQKARLAEIVRRNVTANDIKIIPQSMGPYYEFMLTADGLPAQGRSVDSESWGVVEIGYFTTDFMLVQEGRWVERASGVCSGVRVAAEHLVRLLAERNITIDLVEAEEALRTGFIRDFGKKHDVSDLAKAAADLIVTEVIDTAARLMEPFARRIDGVIVAGGGGALCYPLIKGRWPHAILATDSRFSVSEGMRRIGLARALARSMPT